MPTNPLTPAEAEELHRLVAQRLRWLNALCERLKARGYGPDDFLYREAEGARAHVQDLLTAAHYEGMAPGQAYKPVTPPPPADPPRDLS